MRNTRKEITQGDQYTGMKSFRDEREALTRGLMEMIRIRAEELASLGFSPEMAQFDCLSTLKMIVDDLHGQFDVGHARQEWYREYVHARVKDPT
jgi:hypothetical protein